ncbi:MAG: hypothetical protein WCT11_02560 [Candidatus Magasanikbacteria bacterium]|jgi:hypothetical protein
MNVEDQVRAILARGFTKVHEDGRRAIFELNCPEVGFSVKVLVVKSAFPLGNHFHERTTETFDLKHGNGLFLHADTKMFVLDVQHTAISAPFHVMVEPGTAHAFVLAPGSVLVYYANEAFNENDQDIHPFVLV